MDPTVNEHSVVDVFAQSPPSPPPPPPSGKTNEEDEENEHPIVDVFPRDAGKDESIVNILEYDTVQEEKEKAEKVALKWRRNERLLYAAGSAVLGGVFVVADIYFVDQFIRKGMWRRTRKKQIGRHFSIAFSITLKLVVLFAFIMTLPSFVVAWFPHLELRMQSRSLLASSLTGETSEAKPMWFKYAFLSEYMGLALPTLTVLSFWAGTVWMSASIFEIREVLNQFWQKSVITLTYNARRIISPDENESTRAIQKKKEVEELEMKRRPAWKDYMIIHAFIGIIVLLFTYIMIYQPFEKDVKNMKGMRQNPSTASIRAFHRFKNW